MTTVPVGLEASHSYLPALTSPFSLHNSFSYPQAKATSKGGRRKPCAIQSRSVDWRHVISTTGSRTTAPASSQRSRPGWSAGHASWQLSAVGGSTVSSARSAQPAEPAATLDQAKPSQPRVKGAGVSEFFERDIVNYGDRYERPDRFPRLKASGPRHVAPQEWLRRLRQDLHQLCGDDALGLTPGPSASGGACLEEGPPAGEADEIARRHRLLLAQGRLEECVELISSDSAARRSEQAQAQAAGGGGGLDHEGVLCAALAGGNVEVAFEYASLLAPPSVHWYNVLMACFVCARHHDGLLLALGTLQRRGLRPDALTVALLVAGHHQAGELQEAERVYGEALAVGTISGAVSLEALKEAAALPSS
eukprot:jgi/Mesen1/2734/ME000169S01905